MKTEKIEIDGMNCESCERLITKSVSAAGGKVNKISAREGYAVIEYPEGDLPKMEKAIEEAGYSIGGGPYSQVPLEKQLSDFASDFLAGKPSTKPLRDCFVFSVATFLVLAASVFFLFGTHKYFPYFMYTVISAVAVAGAVELTNAYKKHLSCMEGMMVGMTVGMSSGFLLGAVIGATNGMFVGSVFGMGVGMVLGLASGRHCGIMGAMEGVMAGIMSGTMGAMLTVMMVYDHLEEFMPIFVFANILVLAGFKYMLYHYPGRRGHASEVSPYELSGLALALVVLTMAVAIYAPRSGAVI